ncbi:MAG: hypothetical protein JZD40_04470 [Sulfolobus sp.]|nr:hypothetical protein [Sulfolobus sp.]
MECPWLRNGICTSPKFNGPDASAVVGRHCYESYTSCSLYTPKSIIEETLEKSALTLSPLEVYIIETPSKSDCPYFMVKKVRNLNYYYAYCEILRRPLTRSQAKNCVKFPNSCPFRR